MKSDDLKPAAGFGSIGPFDLVEVKVTDPTDPDVQGDVTRRVSSPGGTFVLGLIPDGVRIASLSETDAAAAIAKRYRDEKLIADPKVQVHIVEPWNRAFTIYGGGVARASRPWFWCPKTAMGRDTDGTFKTLKPESPNEIRMTEIRMAKPCSDRAVLQFVRHSAFGIDSFSKGIRNSASPHLPRASTIARLTAIRYMPDIKTLDDQPPAADSVETPGHSIVRALRHKNYRLFFAGQLISLVGTFLTQTATLWFVYRLTKSYDLMGTILFLGQLPLFLLTPFAGVVADRVQRRRFIVWTQILSMVQSLGLAALAYYFGRGAHPDMHIIIPGLIGLAAFQGIVNAFDLPARQAFIVEIVTDRADLANAIALNSTMVHGARMIGPAAAGLIIYYTNESYCFFLDGISYIAVIIALLAMNVVPIPPRKRGSVGEELIEGLKYAWHFLPIRTLLIFMAALSLTGMPAVQLLMPVFGDYFGRSMGHQHGSQIYGSIGAASGIGALIGAVFLAARKTVLGLGRLIGISVGVFGLSILCFALSRHLWISLMIIPFAGWGMITAFASSNTIIQTLVDDDKRGRVMSLFGLAFLGMAPFGSLLAGTVAHRLTPAGDGIGPMITGASRTLLIAGGITMVGTLVYFTRLPAIRRAARPIYIKKGILPEVASGLQMADEVAGAD